MVQVQLYAIHTKAPNGTSDVIHKKAPNGTGAVVCHTQEGGSMLDIRSAYKRNKQTGKQTRPTVEETAGMHTD